MDDERISGAIARIEAAAARIAASAQSISKPVSEREPVGNPNAKLVQKHELLREEAAQVISELDLIIGKLGS